MTSRLKVLGYTPSGFLNKVLKLSKCFRLSLFAKGSKFLYHSDRVKIFEYLNKFFFKTNQQVLKP